MLMHLLLFIVLALTVFHFYIRYRRIGRLASAIPGPSPYPFIGNMLSFDISSPVSMWLVLRQLSNQYYPITRVWMTTEALYSVRHPDDIEIALTSRKTIDKGWVYKYLHPWLRTGLLTSSGEKWRHRRKILTPAFHFNILRKYMDITQEQGEKLIKFLQCDGKESVQSLIPFCSKFTLNIICESAMGVALDSLDTKTIEKYKQAIYKIGEITVYRMPRPYIHDWMLKLVPFLPINRHRKQALSILHEFTAKVLKERKEYHDRTGNKYLQGLTEEDKDGDEDVYMGCKKRLAMLDLLLSAEKDGLIDDEGIKEEVDTFTFEGHDTTGMAMTFILMLLAENKNAQDKARAEVNEMLKKNNGILGIAEVQELHYLERCIKESMRLYPPVPTIFRDVSEDLQFKHGLIPGGSCVVCHFYDLHRDPNFWDEPDKFDPDRFLLENSSKRHPFAYIPFSAGSRNCIGQKFALLELKSILGRILQNFYLEPVTRLADIKLIADLVLRPSEPVHLKFVKIEKNT
ncbi:cytochrome P450 4AB23 [Nasonia vitripennis]|uniref:Cytochrome P450 n=1 Tax=Nasonia vitripennis TaxID=7425 RepID=A0A7M6UM96_NASVI|nr:cytochrome P450 4AB23 [Nasonia vitripennis]